MNITIQVHAHPTATFAMRITPDKYERTVEENRAIWTAVYQAMTEVGLLVNNALSAEKFRELGESTYHIAMTEPGTSKWEWVKKP